MFEWDEFLDLAKELAQSARNEASIRTAISRAYYCVYHRATAACRARLPMQSRRHQIWIQLRDFGVHSNRPEFVEIGRRGMELHWLRIQVDYHNPYNVNNRRMKPLIALALDVIVQAEELLDLIDRL